MTTMIECTDSDTDEIEDETCVKAPLIPSNKVTRTNNISSEFVGFETEDNSIRTLPPGKHFHLFVSHASEDLNEVNDLCQELRELFSLKCFNYEQDIIGGQLIEENIRMCMEKSEKVLIILSPHYLRSQWCKGELAEALEMASKRNCCVIIPVILKPIDISRHLPSTLKPYRCIDKEITPDVAARIAEAYHFQDLDKSSVTMTEDGVKQQNGARLVTKRAYILSPFLKKGYVFKFPPLTTKDIETLDSYDVKCNEQYEAVRRRVNKHGFIRRYRMFVEGRFSRVVATFVSLITLCLVAIFYCLIILIQKNNSAIEGVFIAFGAVGFSSLSWIVSFFAFPLARRKLLKLLRKEIWKENVKYFEDTKCFIVFDNTILAEPSLCVIRYDTVPCKEYLGLLLDRKFRAKGEEAKKHYIKMIMRCQLEDLQIKGQLATWSLMPGPVVNEFNRHNTWMGKQCICQMLLLNGIFAVRENKG